MSLNCLKIWRKVPTYEYTCTTCKESLEINRSFSDNEIVPPCKKCGYEMARFYSPIGVQFKGNGFYKTDNPK
jgi:putative FmdB family regulatory protein